MKPTPPRALIFLLLDGKDSNARRFNANVKKTLNIMSSLGVKEFMFLSNTDSALFPNKGTPLNTTTYGELSCSGEFNNSSADGEWLRGQFDTAAKWLADAPWSLTIICSEGRAGGTSDVLCNGCDTSNDKNWIALKNLRQKLDEHIPRNRLKVFVVDACYLPEVPGSKTIDQDTNWIVVYSSASSTSSYDRASPLVYYPDGSIFLDHFEQVVTRMQGRPPLKHILEAVVSSVNGSAAAPPGARWRPQLTNASSLSPFWMNQEWPPQSGGHSDTSPAVATAASPFSPSRSFGSTVERDEVMLLVDKFTRYLSLLAPTSGVQPATIGNIQCSTTANFAASTPFDVTSSFKNSLEDWTTTATTNSRCLLLLGSSGDGKTHIVESLHQKICGDSVANLKKNSKSSNASSPLFNGVVVPLFVRLTSKTSLESFDADWLKNEFIKVIERVTGDDSPDEASKLFKLLRITHNVPFVIFFDGYDTITKKGKLFPEGSPLRKNCFVVVTCRPENLTPSDDALFQKWYVAPLTEQQQINYINACKEGMTTSEREWYERFPSTSVSNTLDVFPGIRQLCKQPLLLTIVVPLLPELSLPGEGELVKLPLTTFLIFELLVQRRLETVAANREDVLNFSIRFADRLRCDEVRGEGKEFLSEADKNDFLQSVARNNDINGISEKLCRAGLFHGSSIESAVSFRSRTQSRYSYGFIHCRIKDYFLAAALDPRDPEKNIYFGKVLLTLDDSSLIALFAERVYIETDFSELLKRMILKSKGMPTGSVEHIRAANALTVLCASQTPMTRFDFSGCNVSRALLHGGQLIQCNFDQADFTGCDVGTVQLIHPQNMRAESFQGARELCHVYPTATRAVGLKNIPIPVEVAFLSPLPHSTTTTTTTAAATTAAASGCVASANKDNSISLIRFSLKEEGGRRHDGGRGGGHQYLRLEGVPSTRYQSEISIGWDKNIPLKSAALCFVPSSDSVVAAFTDAKSPSLEPGFGRIAFFSLSTAALLSAESSSPADLSVLKPTRGLSCDFPLASEFELITGVKVNAAGTYIAVATAPPAQVVYRNRDEDEEDGSRNPHVHLFSLSMTQDGGRLTWKESRMFSTTSTGTTTPPISTMCFHPTVKQLIVSAGHKMSVWEFDFSSNDVQSVVVEHPFSSSKWCIDEGDDTVDIDAIAYSEDGSYMAIGGKGKEIKLWELPQPPPRAASIKGVLGPSSNNYDHSSLRGHSNFVTSLCFRTVASSEGTSDAPSFQLISGAFDNEVRVWPVQPTIGFSTRRVEASQTFPYSANQVHAIASAPSCDPLLLSGDLDGKLTLWSTDRAPLQIGRYMAADQFHHTWTEGLRLSSDAQSLFSCSQDRTVRHFHAETGTQQEVKRWQDESAWWTYSVSLSPCGNYVAATNVNWTANLEYDRARIAVWRVRDPCNALPLDVEVTDHSRWARVEWVAGDTLVTGGCGGKIQLWRFSENTGKLTAVGDSVQVDPLKVNGADQFSQLCAVRRFRSQEDNCVAVGGTTWHAPVSIWSTKNSQLTHVASLALPDAKKCDNGVIQCIDVSQDDSMLAACGSLPYVSVWNLSSTDMEMNEKKDPTWTIDHFHGSPRCPLHDVNSVALIAPSCSRVDGRCGFLVASAGDDKVVRLWRLLPPPPAAAAAAGPPTATTASTAAPVVLLHAFTHTSGVQTLCFDPTRRRLFTGSMDGIIRCFDVIQKKKMKKEGSTIVAVVTSLIPKLSSSSHGSDGDDEELELVWVKGQLTRPHLVADGNRECGKLAELLTPNFLIWTWMSKRFGDLF